MKPLSIGLRLTTWYLAILLAAMLVFGGGIWWSMRAALLGHVSSQLSERVAGLQYFLEHETHGVDLAALGEESREYSSGLPVEHGLRVETPDGKSLFRREPSNGDVLWMDRSFRVKGHDLHVRMAAPIGHVSETLNQLTNVILGLTPFMLIAAGACGWWLSRRALRPVDEMISAAGAISIHDLSTRLPLPGTADELHRLGEAWNRMLDRLSASVQQISRFTADAAHELRTPVAIIRSGAELALHRDRPAAEYRAALGAIEKESRSLSKLLEDLMWLARHDAGKSSVFHEAVDLDELVVEATAAMTSIAANRNVRLHVEATGIRPMVWGDPMALRRLVIILLDNAIKYSPAEGLVETGTYLSGESVRLYVRDQGAGVPLEHLPYIFERFYRTDTSRITPGSGLGLAIAKAIVEEHGGTISARCSGEDGTRFMVELPLRGGPLEGIGVRVEGTASA